VNTHLFLTKYKFVQRLTIFEVLAGLLSAIVHDYKHPGTTNAHEIKMRSQLSTRYSDQSVLERHHIASSFDVMLDPKNSLLGGLTEDDYRTVRKLMVDLVLFTDLEKHFEFISKLKTLNEMVAMSRTSERSSSRSSSMRLDFWKSPLMHEKVETSLVLTVAIKFADLGHAHKPFNLHKLWTDRVTEEFWRLGDKEKKSGVGISPLCDREKDVNIPKQQIGFFQFVCNPFFRAVAQLVDPQMKPYHRLLENHWEWHRQTETSQPKLGDLDELQPVRKRSLSAGTASLRSLASRSESNSSLDKLSESPEIADVDDRHRSMSERIEPMPTRL